MAEAGGVATVSATLSAASGLTVTVDLAFSGTATLTSDYTRSGTSIVIPPGSTNGSITLTAIQDALDEVDETIVVDIASVSNGTEPGTQQVTATIIDDDGPTISINNVTVTEGNTGSTVNANFSVSLSAASPQSITVDYSTADGAATAPADYVAKSGTVTFPANSTTPQTISIVVNGDNIDEVNETFTVNLTNAVHATIANGAGTATIIDNDNPPTVAFSLASSSGAESVTPANLAVSLSAVSGKTVTVDYSVSGGTATGGGVDYTLASGTLSFAPGVTNRNVALAVVNDALNELNETVLIALTNPTNTTLGAIATHTYTIIDDDPPPSVTLSLSGSPMAEAGGVATVTATLSAPSGQTVTVDLAFSGTATLGSDYTNSGTSIVVPPGSTNGTITLTAVHDALDEADETVIVDISNVTNGTESGTQQVTAIITDDDSPPTVAFSAATSSGAESTTAVSVPVSLSSASSKSITVNYAVSGGSATGGGVDYTLASGTLTFAPGVTNQNISIDIVDDALDEANETIQVALSNPTNATLGTTTTHTYTITDNDAPPTVTLDLSGSPMAESGGSATVTATLSSLSGQTVTVNLAFSGTATVTSDYTRSGTSIVIPPGSTIGSITLNAVSDALN